MENVEEVKKRDRGKGSRYGNRYGFDIKLRCVKLRLEEGFPASLLSKEMGVSKDVVYRWVRAYQEGGEEGLRNRIVFSGRRRKLPLPVRERIVEIKKHDPLFGVKRISHLLKRMFFLRASPEAVRQTLQEESLITSPRKKPHPNPSRPRFFERATPNQMWQGDIFPFRLGGRYAYLIGCIDDYSRYIVGLELYRTQTGENVLEVYRRAVSEYGVPKEMLTDNGRQYTNWRGVSRFEKELQKDHTRHIKSQPHHPMTLGKMERFWKTIFVEFLNRAQFGSFDEARERVKQWVQYYNHKRPHQGILGLCPADRFFEIQGELRKTIEQGVAENVLEMALRGKPRSPFYMVGRMEGQSVVLRAEKGKLRLLVDDENEGTAQELVYDVSGQGNSPQEERQVGHGEAGEGGEDGKTDPNHEAGEGARGPGEESGGIVAVDGETQARGAVPGAGRELGAIKCLAGAGDGGDSRGASAAGCLGGEDHGIEPPCGIVGEEEQGDGDEGFGAAFSPLTGEPDENWGLGGDRGREEGLTIFRGIPSGEADTESGRDLGGDEEAGPGAVPCHAPGA
jgi:transposase InsO family protein